MIQITDNLYKLNVDDFVNIIAFTGPEGVLLVDSGFEETAAEVQSILEKRNSGNIRYIINTHSDYDHIAGNPALRENAVVVSHANCKAQLMKYAEPDFDIPFNKEIFCKALPTITFEEPLTLHFNGVEIQIIPLIGGHTDEDTIVYFKNVGVAYLGDMVSIETFPVVKLNNGGNAKTLVENVEKLMSLFPEETVLVVGHGRDTTIKELHTYHKMLISTIEIVGEALKKDMPVDEMISANILTDWMSYHEPKYEETKAETWIKTVYQSLSEFPVLKGPYLGQKPPGMEPELFAPGVVSTDKDEINSVFTPDGKEFYFSRDTYKNISKAGRDYTILFTKEGDQGWSKPRVVSFVDEYMAGDMCISPDNRYLFFCSDRPLKDDQGRREDSDIWFVERTENGWAKPKNAGPQINSDESEWYPSITKNGVLYFSSSKSGHGKSDIHRAKFKEGLFQKSENIGPPVNSKYRENDIFIAQDESFLIVVSSDRPDSFGSGDLYISFRKQDGSWTEPTNMGEPVNSSELEYCPVVSPEGKYLFFTSRRRENDDIYWMDAKVLEKQKPDNMN